MSEREIKHSDDRLALSARLKEAREYLSLSQEEVAQALDVPRSAISLIESGQRKVDALELAKFAKLYQRSVDYFTGAKQPAIPSDVQFLAKTASKLSDRDRNELVRFAEYLRTRSKSGDQ